MTNKAQAVLQKMRKQKPGQLLRLFRSPQAREQVLEEFNQSTLDDVGPVGWGPGLEVLREKKGMTFRLVTMGGPLAT
jgi:hypothetical protein